MLPLTLAHDARSGLRPSARAVIRVQVRERVPETPVCLSKSSGCAVCASFVVCFADIESRRRLTARCTTDSTSAPRVTCSRTRMSWLKRSTNQRLRSSVRRTSRLRLRPEDRKTTCARKRESQERTSQWASRLRRPHPPRPLLSLLPPRRAERSERARLSSLQSANLLPE